jgi:hypothetical protein
MPALVAAGSVLLGCSSPSAPTPGAEKAKAVADGGASTPKPSKPKPEFVGTLQGIVKLATGAELPLAPLPPRGKTDTVVAPGCPDINEADRRQVHESPTTGGIFPLHVAITQMTEAPQREPMTHDMEIRDCRLWPGMVAMRTGDKLRVINKSKAPFLPVLPRESFMQALLPDTERETTVSGIGPVTIKCGFASYCGEAVLVSTAHTLYAVTDSSGRFTISGVPINQKLKVFAWHPLFKAASADFELTSGERTKDVELSIEPAPTITHELPLEPVTPEKPAPKKKPAK